MGASGGWVFERLAEADHVVALVWARLGLAVDLATSVVIIGVVLFVFVAIAYAIHGGD